MASCFENIRQGMVEKEKFIMTTLPSKVTSDVNISSPSVVDQFASILGDKMNDSQKFIHKLLLNLVGQVETLNKGKYVDHSFCTETIKRCNS